MLHILRRADFRTRLPGGMQCMLRVRPRPAGHSRSKVDKKGCEFDGWEPIHIAANAYDVMRLFIDIRAQRTDRQTSAASIQHRI